jgi:hypothetical protein
MNLNPLSSRQRRGSGPLAGTAMAALLIGAACNSPLPSQPQNKAQPGAAESDVNELIGGFSANDRRLDGIGSLVVTFPPDPYYPYPQPPQQVCSAALIAPETVLTAKHCVDLIPLIAQLGLRYHFALGADAANPRRMVEIVAYEMAPGDYGGFVGMGRDVGIVHLDNPITDEPMLAVGSLSDADLGKAYAAIGYGVQDNSGKAGTRRLGKQTLRGREGKVFEILFGSFERFFDWFKSGVVTPDDIAALVPGSAPTMSDAGPARDAGASDGGTSDVYDPDQWLREYALMIYNSVVLEKDYEIVTGGAAGDSQVCYGDSGSPLVKLVDGKYTAYGVVSGGIGSRDLICDVGAVYASFGPEVATFIDNAKTWVDPCGDQTSAGFCDGSIARRCTNTLEGRRRMVEFDCASLALECNMQTGQVACGDVALAPTPPIPPTKRTPPNLRALVDRVFKLGFLKK